MGQGWVDDVASRSKDSGQHDRQVMMTNFAPLLSIRVALPIVSITGTSTTDKLKLQFFLFLLSSDGGIVQVQLDKLTLE